MFADTKPFHSFAVNDAQEAQRFYGETLGMDVSVLSEEEGLLTLHLSDDQSTLIYTKHDHTPAGFTILDFPVEDVDAAVAALAERGVELERYDGFEHDEKGIVRGPGPQIAWFKDPAGNVLAVLQNG